jgi:hypothetical protein
MPLSPDQTLFTVCRRSTIYTYNPIGQCSLVVLTSFSIWANDNVVGTLQTGYPHIQALSQDKRQGVRLHTAMWPAVSDPTTQHRRAAVLSRVLPLQTPPPSTKGLWSCCVFRSFGPRLLAQEGSGAAMHPAAPDPASPCGRASVRPLVPWHSAGCGL